jgi:nucleoside diphosphate kinase
VGQTRLIILKPDAVRELKVGELICKIEARATILQMEMRPLFDDEISRIYHAHIGQWYWDRQFAHMKSGACVLVKAFGDYFDDLKRVVRVGRENPENLIHVEDTENFALTDFLFSHHQ